MVPLIWTRSLAREGAADQRVVCSTIGASQDFLSEGLRRVMVNACYWCLGMEEELPARSNVEIVGPYEPSPFGFNRAKQGVMPAEHALQR